MTSLQGPLELSLGKCRLIRRMAVVSRDANHAVDARGGDIALLLLDADDVAAQRLAHLPPGIELWSRLNQLALPSMSSTCTELFNWVDVLLQKLGTQAPARVHSGPILRAIRFVAREVEHVPRLADAALAAQLSPSRLSHLFRAEVGLPFRRFVLWARLKRAAEVAARGASITECALAAGFSDGAHFSRTFRRHFGLSPSAVLSLIELDPTRWPSL